MPDTVAVRPPEYFPGLAYMALVQAADVFVMADTFRHSRRSMQSRGRLRTPQGRQWISVPLKSGQRGRARRKVEIENRERWLVKHWRAFQYNYRTTPYFEYYELQVAPFFERAWQRLGPLSCASVELLHELLALPVRLVRASALPGRPDTLPAILEQVEADPLMTLPDAATPDAAQAPRVEALRFEAPTYRQNFDGFEEGLSAADLVFNYGPEAAAMLRSGTRIEAR